MIIKIFESPASTNALKEPEVYLKLEQRRNSVYLRACDKTGETLLGGNLLRIGEEGLRLLPDINTTIGFPIDGVGKLRVR